MQRKKILWLVSWYPNKDDSFDGDFIQRHARAAAIYHDIHLIFVTSSDSITAPEEVSFATGLTEEIIYFRRPYGLLSTFKKMLHFNRLFREAVDKYITKYGLPEGIHVHIPWKAGLVGLWAKEKYKIPFL